jgi:hypothetical protein
MPSSHSFIHPYHFTRSRHETPEQEIKGKREIVHMSSAIEEQGIIDETVGERESTISCTAGFAPQPLALDGLWVKNNGRDTETAR